MAVLAILCGLVALYVLVVLSGAMLRPLARCPLVQPSGMDDHAIARMCFPANGAEENQ